MTSLRRPLASGARRRPGRRAGGGRRGGGGGGGGNSERLRVTRGPAPPLCRGREPLEGARRPPVRARGSRGLRAVPVPVQRGGDAPLPPAADLRYELLLALPRLPGRRFPSRFYPSSSCFITPRPNSGHKRWPGPRSRPRGAGRAPPAAAEGSPAPCRWGVGGLRPCGRRCPPSSSLRRAWSRALTVSGAGGSPVDERGNRLIPLAGREGSRVEPPPSSSRPSPALWGSGGRGGDARAGRPSAAPCLEAAVRTPPASGTGRLGLPG